MTAEEKFIKRLKASRKERGMTREEVVEQCRALGLGIDLQRYLSIELGKNKVLAREVAVLCKVLEINLCEVFASVD